ncbi:MAG: hypothetical protein AB1505_19360, partial [Candidatus Latescibacterota bacterium]
MVSRVERAAHGSRVLSPDQDLYLDAAALDLHSSHNGLERLFRHIAAAVDGEVPAGDDWHRKLLNQM